MRGSFIAEAISTTVRETASGKNKYALAETVILQVLFVSSISISRALVPLLSESERVLAGLQTPVNPFSTFGAKKNLQDSYNISPGKM